MINPIIARILQAATHWARDASKEFDAHCAACTAPLALSVAEGGAVTLRGTVATGDVISICLTPTQHLHLVRHGAVKADGYAAIHTVEHYVTLPRHLRTQLAQLEHAA